MGVLKKTIGISSKKSLKVFRQGEALVVWSKAEPWTPEKKLGEVTSPGPWPLIKLIFQVSEGFSPKVAAPQFVV